MIHLSPKALLFLAILVLIIYSIPAVFIS